MANTFTAVSILVAIVAFKLLLFYANAEGILTTCDTCIDVSETQNATPPDGTLSFIAYVANALVAIGKFLIIEFFVVPFPFSLMVYLLEIAGIIEIYQNIRGI